ncbi:MAG: hypothetical protein ACXVPE_16810 [Bacteroidia bacterium]
MVLFIFLAVLGVSFLLFLWKGGSIFGYLILIAFIAIATLSMRFTNSLNVDSNSLSIQYTRWFINRTIKIDRNNLTTKIGKGVTYRGGTPYVEIYFVVNGKTIYTVNSNDGFDEDELKEFATKINQLSSERS